MNTIDKFVLLKNDIKTNTEARFKKNEILYKLFGILTQQTVYVDSRNPLRRLHALEGFFERLYTSKDIDMVLNISKGFIKDKDDYNSFCSIVERRLG